MTTKRLANVILPPSFDTKNVQIPPTLPPPDIHIPDEEELNALQRLVEDMKRIQKENEQLDQEEWEEENRPTLLKDLKSFKAHRLFKLCNSFYLIAHKL